MTTTGPRHGAELLAHMEALLAAWRPSPGEAFRDIPLLTETPLEEDPTAPLPAPMPSGMSREVLQAHLSEAAEQMMVTLYRDLSTDLNERMAEEMRRLIEHGIARATQTLRQQILVSVAESLNHSVEQAGKSEAPHPQKSRSKSKP